MQTKFTKITPVMAESTKTIAFRVPLSTAEALETQAAKERRTLSNYLNGVIEKHVKALARQRKTKRANGK